MELKCPYCGKLMKEHYRTVEMNPFHGFGCEGDYDGLLCKEYYYKCPDCKIEYSDDGWKIPKKLKKDELLESEITDKQKKVLILISNKLNIILPPFFSKEQVKQFIHEKIRKININ